MPASQTTSQLLVALCVLVVTSAMVVVPYLGRPVALSGLELDERLTIQEGSRPPSERIAAGDRVTALGGIPVSTPRALAAQAAALSGADVPVRVELVGRTETVLLNAESLPEEAARFAEGNARVTAIAGQPVAGDPDLEQLRVAIAASPNGWIEVELTSVMSAEGPIRVGRGVSSMPTMGWLLILLLGLAGVALVRNRKRGAVAPLPMSRWLALAAGGAATAGLAALWTQPLSPPMLALWTYTIIGVYRGARVSSALVTRRRRGVDVGGVLFGVAPAALLAGGAAWMFLQESVSGVTPAWLLRLDQMEMAVGLALVVYHAADVWLAASRGRLRQPDGLGTSAGALAVAGLALYAWAIAADPLQVVRLSMLLLTAFAWLGDLASDLLGEGALPGLAEHDDDPEPDVVDALSRLQRAVPSHGIAFAVGLSERWVLMTRHDPAGDGNWEVSVQAAAPALGVALSVVRDEGGRYPRPVTGDDDVLVGIGDRVAVWCVVPVHLAAVSILVVAFVGDEDGGDGDPELLLQTLARMDQSVLRAELTALAAAAVLERAESAAQAPAAPSPSLVAEGPAGRPEPRATETRAPARNTPTRAESEAPQDGQWAEWLQRELDEALPLEDEEVLTPTERDALLPWAMRAEPLLIVGEPGVGKTVIARAIHAMSPRAQERIATLDCATTPPSLVSALLFGEDDEPGLVRLVADGTLLIKSVSVLGGGARGLLQRLARTSVRVVVIERVVAGREPAALGDLRAWSRENELRVTPLRERRRDVARLAGWYAHRLAMVYDRPQLPASHTLWAQLRTEPLLGNFHTLNAMVLAAVLADEPRRAAGNKATASEADSAASTTGLLRALGEEDADDTGSFDGLEDEAERLQILSIMQQVEGNRTQAAKLLGMTRGKLLRRLRKYGLDDAV